MTKHLLTMETNAAHDRLWLHCSCGWRSGPLPVGSQEEAQAAADTLMLLGSKHFGAAGGWLP